MGIQKTCNNLIKKSNDVIYTPLDVVKMMINICDIKKTDKVLDCSKGGGVFFDNLPECKKDWCEITEGKDFFEYDKECDVIIGNPPYSLWTKWLEHSVKQNPKKICYIFGCINLTPVRLFNMEQSGYYLTKMIYVKVDWWFQCSIICLFEKRDVKPLCIEEYVKECVLCDVCHTRCKRGRNGNSPNVCTEVV